MDLELLKQVNALLAQLSPVFAVNVSLSWDGEKLELSVN